MKTSYNQACGMNCSTLEQDLVLAEQAGFDFIEMRLDMLHAYLETHTLADLQNFFAKSHLKPHALNALYLYDDLFADGDDLARQTELMDEFRFGLEVAQAVDAGYFIVVPPLQRDPNGGPYIGTEEATFANCCRILPRLSAMAQPYGIKLCFELVGFTRSSVRTVPEVKAIVEAVNLDNVGYVMDSYNLFLYDGSNDFSALATVAVDKMFAAHLTSGDDVPADQRGQDKRCFAGSGAVDTAQFLDTLHQMGYTGMVSAETFRPAYWEESAEWVVNTAYATTAAAIAPYCS